MQFFACDARNALRDIVEFTLQIFLRAVAEPGLRKFFIKLLFRALIRRVRQRDLDVLQEWFGFLRASPAKVNALIHQAEIILIELDFRAAVDTFFRHIL